MITLSEQVVYTTQITTSLTSQTGNVVGIYHDQEKKKCLILLKFDSTDALSIDASDYQMFIAGFNPAKNYEQIKKIPSGCIYMLGSTGYMAIYLTSVGGFEEQILGLTVRCNKTLVETQVTNASYEYMDTSFDDYDQFRVYFNPGGKNVTYLSSMDEDTINIYDIFKEIFVKPKEAEIKNLLQEDVKELFYINKTMQEYKDRLKRYRVTSYITPMQIDEDALYIDNDGKYCYVPKYIIKGGVDFDWQNYAIEDSLKKIRGDLTPEEFFTNLENECATEPEMEINPVFYMADGSEVDTDLSTNYEVVNAINLLKGRWESFYEVKKKYQTEDLISLLKLEKEAEEVKNDYTMNISNDVLQGY